MRKLTARVLTTALLATSLVCGLARAEGRELTERHEHVDARHQHNHSYLDRDVVVAELPRGANRVRFGGARYWYDGGVWYRAEGPRYLVIAPPVGAVVDVLPPYYTTVRFGGLQYYYANDAYYLFSRRERGFQVVEPPAGIEAGSLPPAGAGPSAGENVFVYPRNGQSPEQQAKDRYECHRWAADQTGFDPTREGVVVAPAALAPKRADYGRADNACLEGRGYTVR